MSKFASTGDGVPRSAAVAPRVLVCLEDTTVAVVVTGRLMRDGVDGVVVDKPAKLVEEARKGAVTLVVQDRYASGDIGSSLLRQVRVARGEVLPAVVLVTGDLAAPDRHVLEKQYKVQVFLPMGSSPLHIAEALRGAGGLRKHSPDKSEDDLVLHEDEVKNDFDISIESQAAQIDAAFNGAFDDEEDVSLKTVEISQAELQRLKKTGALGGTPRTAAEQEMSARRIHEEITNNTAPGAQTVESDIVDKPIDLSELPAPGGDNDFDLRDGPATAKSPSAPATTSSPAPPAQTTPPVSAPLVPQPISVAAAVVTRPAPPSPTATGNGAPKHSTPSLPPPHDPPSVAADDEEDPMQIQELQRTQAELKRALLAERKARETAQKRVEELEARLTKMGEAPTSTGQGVPAEGVFEDLRYPALLARARAEAFTGSIAMATGGATRTVYLKDGLPVAFSSSEPGQRIGKVLVSQGRITDEQYMKAATRMVEKSIKLTDALVELGLIDAESLAIEQRNLTRDQIIQGFEIVQGRFTTTAGAAPDVNTATFDFGPGEIYVQGYRRYAPPSEMLAGFETLRDKYLIANARLAGFRAKLGLSGEDERLIRLLGEALTVEEAVERASLTAEHCARLLAALQALDLVEEWSPGVEQFRSRIRAERQRQAEEITAHHQEQKRREDRLLEAFERALNGRGDASSLRTAMGSPLVTTSAERLPEKREEKREEKRTQAATPFAKDAASKPPSSSSTLASTLSSAMASPSAPSSASSSSPPSISASPSSYSSSSSTASEPFLTPIAAAPAATAPLIPTPTPEVSSPADKKYREGIEQASQNRLDEAELTLREAVRLDATRPEYLTSLARVLLENPRYERAGTLPVVRSLLDRAVQIAPDHTEAVDLHKQVIAEMA